MPHALLRSHALDNLASWPLLLPEGLLVLTLVGVLGLSWLPGVYQRYALRPMAVTGVLLAGASKYQLAAQLSLQPTLLLFNQLLVVDPLAVFFCWLLLGVTGLLLLVAPLSLVYVVLLLGALLGSSLLVMANHWLVLYLGLSLVSMASALLMSSRPAAASAAAGLQYWLYSMVAGAVMLWGMGYCYGLTGTLAVSLSAEAWHAEPLLWVVLLLCLSYLLFVLAVVPFHFWVPAVYGAAPAGVVAYVATVPKLAAVGALLRLSQQLLPVLGPVSWEQGQQGLGILALLTMGVGHVGALQQTNWRYVLAYGSIAQGGLLLAGVAAVPHCQAGVLYYSAVYGAMGWAAWIGLQALQQEGSKGAVEDFAGLGRQSPVLGGSATVVMLALVGLPPTAGFTGKWMLLTGLWAHAQATGSGLFWALLGVALLGTVLSLYYYLQLPYVLFARAAARPRQEEASRAAVLVVVMAVLLLGGFFVGPG